MCHLCNCPEDEYEELPMVAQPIPVWVVLVYALIIIGFILGVMALGGRL